MLSLWRKQTVISRQALVTLSGDSSERKKGCLRRCHVAGGWLGSAIGERVRGDIVLKTLLFWRQEVVEDPSMYAWVFRECFFRMFSHYFHSKLVDSDI
jgi:hypothetical protein